MNIGTMQAQCIYKLKKHATIKPLDTILKDNLHIKK